MIICFKMILRHEGKGVDSLSISVVTSISEIHSSEIDAISTDVGLLERPSLV